MAEVGSFCVYNFFVLAASVVLVLCLFIDNYSNFNYNILIILGTKTNLIAPNLTKSRKEKKKKYIANIFKF